MISGNVKQWIEIAGGVTLIASLGVLVLEVRQNTDATSAQAVSDLIHQASELSLAVASNPELAELMLRLQADDPNSVSAIDQLRGEQILRGVFGRVAAAYTFYQRGIFSEAQYKPWLRTLCDLLKSEEPTRFWVEMAPSYDPAFVRDVEVGCKVPTGKHGAA